MENTTKSIEDLLERTVEYGKTTYTLVKLKALDKTSDVVSTIVPHSLVFIAVASFVLFINLGLGFWIGDILGKIYYGFFVIAGFYGLVAVVVHFFMHQCIKKKIYNYIIKQVLK